ncbi:ABC transporter permease, partial [Streptomyces sp. NPDC004126]
FLAIILILVVGIAIDLLIFSPVERWVLRSRGLAAGSS